jgi:hypothetical protein
MATSMGASVMGCMCMHCEELGNIVEDSHVTEEWLVEGDLGGWVGVE